MVFYTSLLIALATKASLTKLVVMICGWLLYQIATLWYGISTGQIGFILMFIFQFIVTIITILVSTERQISEDI
jgi:uncharacterized membrane protein